MKTQKTPQTESDRIQQTRSGSIISRGIATFKATSTSVKLCSGVLLFGIIMSFEFGSFVPIFICGVATAAILHIMETE